ncbi:hypothetical protein [Streptomyces venezuelae]|uniref:preATP grasp domain-containing protein n=1 Tax=Streptomyces venezuelae TaxID=54571 RepID=UPI003331AE94
MDLDEGQILTQWAQQAPRKAWLLRPGDVFVTPVPLSREFLRYVYGLTGVPPESVAVVEVPLVGAVPLARAVREAGLVEHVRALAADRARPCCRRRWTSRRSRSPGMSVSGCTSTWPSRSVSNWRWPAAGHARSSAVRCARFRDRSRDTLLRCRRPARTWPANWRSGG